jgi:hypothetical protein
MLDHASSSHRAHKKRRTEPDLEGFLSADASADNQLEEELTLVLAAATAEDSKSGILNGGRPVGEFPENGAATQGDVPAEVVSVISNLMGHAERVEEQFARDQPSTDLPNQPPAKPLTYIKASSHLKTQSLPILDNLVLS